MKNLTQSLIILSISLLTFACSTPASQNATDISLFEEGASNWSKVGEAIWSFDNGELVGRSDSTAGFVMVNETYQNFELSLEFKPDSTINSGVYIRCAKEEITPTTCFEINIWDLHPNQDNRTGAVVLKATPLAHVETLNKWNTYRITCKGSKIQAWVNGVQTVDLTDAELPSGFIALQAAGSGEVRFKNVKLKPILD